VWPDVTLWALVILFGAWMLVDGGFTLAAVFGGDVREHRGWFVAEGIAGVAIGLITFIWPDVTALALLYLIAAWAFVTGVIRLLVAYRYRRQLDNEWLLALSGALSIALAVILVITPGSGALAITWVIGWFAVLFGVLVLALAFRLRKLESQLRDDPIQRVWRATA
jgi:uncharacterized membrane protein HdeD (DUF308 family)